MFMYINTLRLTTLIIYSSETLFYVTSLIIYAPKTLSNFHHVVKKSAQGEEADFEIIRKILWRTLTTIGYYVVTFILNIMTLQ